MATLNYTFGSDEGMMSGYSEPIIGYSDEGTLKTVSFTIGTAASGSITVDDGTVVCVITNKESVITATGATVETIMENGGDGGVYALLPTGDTVTLSM